MYMLMSQAVSLCLHIEIMQLQTWRDSFEKKKAVETQALWDNASAQHFLRLLQLSTFL